MSSQADLPLTDRLTSLWEHFGVDAAFVATQMPSDITEFADQHPARIAGAVFCTPTRLDPTPFVGIADRLLMIASERGETAGATARAAAQLRGAERIVLADYAAFGWSDVVADRTDEIAAPMVEFFRRCLARGRNSDRPKQLRSPGAHAGVAYRVTGSGPALFLLPFFLAPTQWTAAVPALAKHFTVITLGGPHLGGVAALEDRARAPTYRAMFGNLLDFMAPRPDDAILDVGCGTGSLDRLLARRLGAGATIRAVDVNPFLLGEAAALAATEHLGSAIQFSEGSAVALPFSDNTFDCVFSVTVLEECDADKAIAEMRRVAKPGGKVGVIVRAIDVPQWWSFAIPPAMRQRAETPPQSVTPRGVADASLYRRMRDAGLGDLICFPALVTLDNPDGPIWRFREDYVLSHFTPEEAALWRAARDAAKRDGLLLTAHVMHCAVGSKA